MRRAWIPALAASMALGAFLLSLVPSAWGYQSRWGLCVGVALYFVAFRRVLERIPGTALRPRWIGRDGVLVTALLRAAAFLGLVLFILFVACDLLRGTDLRWPLATLAAWSVADAALERTATGLGSSRG